MSSAPPLAYIEWFNPPASTANSTICHPPSSRRPTRRRTTSVPSDSRPSSRRARGAGPPGRRQLEEVVPTGHKVGVVVRVAGQLRRPPGLKPRPLLREDATDAGAALEVIPHSPRRPDD